MRDLADKAILAALVALGCFCVFGMYMSHRQHSGWAEKRAACVQAGGVPWQAKHSGGPICIRRDAIMVVKEVPDGGR